MMTEEKRDAIEVPGPEVGSLWRNPQLLILTQLTGSLIK